MVSENLTFSRQPRSQTRTDHQILQVSPTMRRRRISTPRRYSRFSRPRSPGAITRRSSSIRSAAFFCLCACVWVCVSVCAVRRVPWRCVCVYVTCVCLRVYPLCVCVCVCFCACVYAAAPGLFAMPQFGPFCSPGYSHAGGAAQVRAVFRGRLRQLLQETGLFCLAFTWRLH